MGIGFGNLSAPDWSEWSRVLSTSMRLSLPGSAISVQQDHGSCRERADNDDDEAALGGSEHKARRVTPHPHGTQ